MNPQRRNLHEGLHGEDVAQLHISLNDLGASIPPEEKAASVFGPGTRIVVLEFQGKHDLELTGTVHGPTSEAIDKALLASTYNVAGKVSSPVSAAVDGLTVELFDKNVGGERKLATTATLPDGSFAFNDLFCSPRTLAERQKTRPDLQARAFAGTTLLASSAVAYNAALSTRLDIELPATVTGLASEYETLTASLARAYSGPLGSLQETAGDSAGPQDITYLAAKTNWDARAVAQASLAEGLSAMTSNESNGPTLPPELCYALLKAGVPADPDAFFTTSPQRVKAIWEQAIATNIIPNSSAASISTSLEIFTRVAASRSLTARAPSAVSTLSEMLTPTLPEAASQAQFAQIFAQLSDNPSMLWPELTKAFGEDRAQSLQLMGRLYALTGNNAPLVAALTKAEANTPIASTVDLVTSGYYQASQWKALIADSVPANVPGSTTEEKTANYAELLATQVRLAHPTETIADQVKRGVLPVAVQAEVVDGVHNFLTTHGAEFQLGSEPVEAFLARKSMQQTPKPVVDGIKRLQRTYQLTPDDSSMSVLLRHNLDSAYAITRYDAASFTKAFAAKLGSADKAAAIHARAKTIFGAVMNVAVTCLAGQRSAAISSRAIVPAQQIAQPADDTAATIPYATLEGLFGSLDFCNCSDCRSILSPAAYLVDLLNFVDKPALADGSANPQDVLFARRPDLQYLPLTCENTNTALPYIDLVNEILEYFVANQLSLDNFQGYDTGTSVTSDEVLASPQFVNDAAYSTLEAAFFPPPLPFNRSLELLRQQLAGIGVTLPQLMIALRGDDSIVNHATPLSYGWQDILWETGTFSRSEAQLFTDPTLTLGQLYGLPDASALATLQSMNLQDFSRRVGVSYVDLSSILQTVFINPDAVLLPRLEQLGVPFTTIADLQSGALSVADFTALLPASLDPSEYNGSAAAWVTDPAIYPRITGIITIADPSAADPCSATALQLLYANPDPTANQLTATDFLKLIRFIRLWQKVINLFPDSDPSSLIEVTDDILSSLYPAASLPVQTGNSANDPGNRLLLDAGFGVLLQRLGFLLRIMTQLSLDPGTDLASLLACWAPIQTVGPNALYNQLFLSPTTLDKYQQAQTVTIAGSLFPGEVLTTTIDGIAVSYSAVTGDTPASAASAIATIINACATIDTVSGLPLNQRFFAETDAGTIIIRTGFTLEASTSAGSTESCTVASSSPAQATLTIAAPTVTPGDVITATINQVAVSITVAGGDDEASLAVKLANAIGSTSAQETYSGLPLNQVVLASAAGAVVTVLAANAATPFSLLCSLSSPDVSYDAGPINPGGNATLTLAGPPAVGDVFTITLDPDGEASIPITYTAIDTDTDLTLLAANIASTIAAATYFGSLTYGSTGTVVGNENVVILDLPSIGTYTLAASVAGAGGGVSGATITASVPTLVSRTATISGEVPVAAEITTTLGSYPSTPVSYTVSAADTLGTIAANIATAINASGNDLYSASSSGNTVTVALTRFWILPFSMVCSVSTIGSYLTSPYIPSHWQTVLSGIPLPGDSVVTTIDGIDVPFTLNSNDGVFNSPTIADLSASINAATALDPNTGLPINQTVVATPDPNASTTTVFLAAIDPTTSFTVACTFVPNAAGWVYGYAASGPINATQSVTLVEPIPPETLLTTTINGTDIRYTVTDTDTAATITAAIAAKIMSDTSVVPNLSGLVTATSSGGTLTLTANAFNAPFELSVTTSAATFVAGRQPSPFASNPYGDFLDDPNQTLFGYEPLLCAACGLTGTEFGLIASALNFDATTVLTLDNASAIFRFGWLAHTLGLSLLEFLALRSWTQLDPFAPLDPASVSPVEPPIVPFLRLIEAMQTAGIEPVQALYLLWNQDITGAAAPAPSAITGLAFALRANFAAVEAQFALQSDPDGSIANGLMTLVYGASATDFFFGLLSATLTPAVPYSNPPGDPSLPQSVVDQSNASLAYDDLRKLLSFAGVLTPAAAAALAASLAVATSDATVNAAPGASTTFTPASMADITEGSALTIDTGANTETVIVATVTPTTFTAPTALAHNGTVTPVPIANFAPLPVAIAALATRSSALIAPFFAIYPELQPLFAAYVASTDPLQTRRSNLLAGFLPALKSKRKQEQALASITAAVDTDPSFANQILTDPTVLQNDAATQQPAIADLTAIEAPGLAAQLFLAATPGTTPDLTLDAAPLALTAATLALTGTLQAGDVLTPTINGVPAPYTVTPSDDALELLAAGLAAAINATVAIDSVSGLPINQAVSAIASGPSLTVLAFGTDGTAPALTLACTSSAGATETATPVTPSPFSIVWSGSLDVPQDGLYNFAVSAPAGATVALVVDGSAAPVAEAEDVWSNTAPIALTAGELPSISLTVANITGPVTVSWESAGLGWQTVPTQYLYSANLLLHLQGTYVRFLKSTSLAASLPLTAPELAALASAAPLAVDTNSSATIPPGNVTITPASMDGISVGATLLLDTGIAQEAVTVSAVTASTFSALTAKLHDGSTNPFPVASPALLATGRGWLNLLGTAPKLDPATQATLRDVLVALLDFSRIKQAVSPTDERLLNVFLQPTLTLPNNTSALLSLTGWAVPSLNALLTHFFGSIQPAVLASVENFRRVFDAYALVTQCRVTASTLISATTNAPSVNTVSALQSSLRALYAEPDWETVVRPINDAMRIRQRDALVAYILEQLAGGPSNISTPDDLFAFFLVDPETQPAVETSRIRLALSSIQLFIERILRNLESSADPTQSLNSSDIDPTQWEWMKRYRVWQANREIFLWPENWLYPELRDDASPLFTSTMSRLLQSDITDDAAADAYLDYLTNLEEIAKLEPCGVYYVPETDTATEITYVVARTSGAKRKYFFRQLDNASWSPWTEVQIECEDLPLTPIVWNGRLFLFWLKAIKQTLPQATNSTPPNDGAFSSLTPSQMQTNASSSITAQGTGSVQVGAVLCWTEFYNNKWQPSKTSDHARPTAIGVFDLNGPNAWEIVRPTLQIVPALVNGNPAGNFFGTGLALTIEPTSAAYSTGTGASTQGALNNLGRGFLLHNTHSRPSRVEDIALFFVYRFFFGPPDAGRQFSPIVADDSGANSDDTVFSINYLSSTNSSVPTTSYGNNVLTASWLPRFTQPQPGLASGWSAPFLYEDRRNVFYVTVDVVQNLFFFNQAFGLATTAPVATLNAQPYKVRPDSVSGPVSSSLAGKPPLAAEPGHGASIDFHGVAIDSSGGVAPRPAPPTSPTLLSTQKGSSK